MWKQTIWTHQDHGSVIPMSRCVAWRWAKFHPGSVAKWPSTNSVPPCPTLVAGHPSPLNFISDRRSAKKTCLLRAGYYNVVNPVINHPTSQPFGVNVNYPKQGYPTINLDSNCLFLGLLHYCPQSPTGSWFYPFHWLRIITTIRGNISHWALSDSFPSTGEHKPMNEPELLLEHINKILTEQSKVVLSCPIPLLGSDRWFWTSPFFWVTYPKSP